MAGCLLGLPRPRFFSGQYFLLSFCLAVQFLIRLLPGCGSISCSWAARPGDP